jgi:predicted YcjX-like family ATPase
LPESDHASLPGFAPALSHGLMGCRLHPMSGDRLAYFPYENALHAYCLPVPAWSDSTSDTSGMMLELLLAMHSSWLNSFRGDSKSLFMEIHDYPSEWLLDTLDSLGPL